MEDQLETTAGPQAKSMERAGRAGMFLSIACALHCLAGPFALVVAPVAGLGALMGGGFHLVLMAVVLASAVACSCWGFRVHRKKRLVMAFAAAAAFVVAGHMVADQFMESVMVILGGIGLVGSHFLNVHLCRTCCATCDNPEPVAENE